MPKTIKPTTVKCPICYKELPQENFTTHYDNCEKQRIPTMNIKEMFEEYYNNNIRGGRWLWFIFCAIIIFMIVSVIN